MNSPSPAEREKRAAAEVAEKALARQIESAWQNGREAGLAEAKAELQAELERIGMDARGRCNALLKNFEQGVHVLEDQLAERVLALALQFGQQIACQHLHSVPDSISGVLNDALQQLGRQYRALDVMVHPDDVETARQWLDLHHPELTVKVLGNPTMSPGGCRLDAGTMTVDASLQTRIERAYAGMGIRAAAACTKIESVKDYPSTNQMAASRYATEAENMALASAPELSSGSDGNADDSSNES
ncbi:MAG: FliH/SctL family protein [Lautropia sp.]|nr:FliH/SctL family protein [Lautropia sp.]